MTSEAHKASATNAPIPPPPPSLEVEQKFALMNSEGAPSRVEKRLAELGFERRGEKDLVDWYFDTPDPNWTLTPTDCWLRCRETSTSGGSTIKSWELKRGLRQHDGSSTVYEELVDDEAIEACLSMLPSMDDDSSTLLTPSTTVLPEEYEGRRVPKLPKQAPLVPFARIETHRSSWALSAGETQSARKQPFVGLVVDLDATQYEYMVGEVEAVVANETDVAAAKQRIGSLVRLLVPEADEDTASRAPPPVGKLEHYLINFRREHYDMCMKGGSTAGTHTHAEAIQEQSERLLRL